MKTGPESYEEYNGEDLLVIISMAEYDPKEAEQAFEELVVRYRAELLRYCITMCNTEANPNRFQVVFDPDDAIDIVWNAFHQIKKNADKFDRNRANTSDINKAVEAYLKGYVRTEFKKKYFWTPRIKVEYNYEVDMSPDGLLMPTRKVLSEMTEEIELAFSVLSWKEREVFLAYAEFCPNGEYLPREISTLLQEKLNLAPSTLRVYRDRAQKKMQNYFRFGNGQ